MTQQELSERSGVPRPTLAHLESGSANPTLSVLARVAQTLGVAMEDLVQAPSSSVTLNRADSLETSEQNGAAVRRLLPSGATGAIAFERIELSVRAEHSRGLGRNLDLCYLACERGEVEVVSGEERAILKSGDVAVVARGAAHSCLNRGRGSAVVYSVRTVATA